MEGNNSPDHMVQDLWLQGRKPREHTVKVASPRWKLQGSFNSVKNDGVKKKKKKNDGVNNIILHSLLSARAEVKRELDRDHCLTEPRGQHYTQKNRLDN